MKNPNAVETLDSQDFSAVAERDEIVSEFLNESLENLVQLDRELNELGLNSPAEVLASSFRTFHTIKGASGFLGFRRLERLTHSGESLLTGLREGKLVLSPAIGAALHEIVGCIREILETIGATGLEGGDDDTELLSKIDKFQRLDHSAAAASDANDADNWVADRSNSAADEDSAKPIGQLLVERAGVSPADVQAARELQCNGDLRTIGEILVSQGVVTSSATREIVEYQQEARAISVADTFVRVEMALLDRLVRLAEEVIHSSNRIVELAGRAHNPELDDVSQRLLRDATQLHDDAIKTRVQPVGSLGAMLNRLVQDLTRLSGKHVRLELNGGEIEVDRVVLNTIKDPLMHLVRNSVDHGIETPRERLAAGKPLEGRITVNATCSNGEFGVAVSDDGAGIDLDRVKQKALEQGAIPSDRIDTISENEIAACVFLPGFTTARTVSHISGRGVGMDIVKTKVEKIGGKVHLLTGKGTGTTVRLAIPLPSLSPVQ